VDAIASLGVKQQELLFLYTSNIRPLYAQDVLDVVAAPEGTLYTFRYDNALLQDRVREEPSVVKGKQALIHFSIQQDARYHEPSFIPVRTGTVTATSREGGATFIEFELRSLVSLKAVEQTEELAEEVRRYTDFIGSISAPRPYGTHAGLGPNVLAEERAGLHVDDDQGETFQRIASYLCPTQSFRNARFLRFLRVCPTGSRKTVDTRDHVLALSAGKTYDLELFHYQPADVTTTEFFDISVDGSLIRLIGRPSFEVGSRYDKISIPLHVLPRGKNEAMDTLVLVEPRPPTQGPRLRIPVRIEPRRRLLFFSALLSALAIAFIGGLGAFDWSGPTKFAIAIAVATAIGMLQYSGLYVGALGAPSYGAVAQPAPRPSPGPQAPGREHDPLVQQEV
jgi:hypothetical protein